MIGYFAATCSPLSSVTVKPSSPRAISRTVAMGRDRLVVAASRQSNSASMVNDRTPSRCA
jgi:hypothetical protein